MSEVAKACRSDTCEKAKLVLGSVAVFLLILVVFVGVSLSYCILQVFPLVNFLLLFACLVLLAYVEALHYACVAVEKWDMKQYEDRFPRAVICHSYVDTPDKVKKFLVGRQFFVIFVVFLIAQITSFPYIPPDFLGMPRVLVLILIQTGLPGIALVLTVGQLISQIYVEEFTIQFLNLYGCQFVIRLSLAAEWIGVCNFSWLLYDIVSRLACKKVRKIQKTLDTIQSTENLNEPPLSPHEANRGPDFDTGLNTKKTLNWFDYLKYCWSTVATLGSVAIVIYGISIQAYVLPVPIAVAYIMVLVLLTNLYYLEGLMIAIVGTQYWDPSTFKDIYPRAYKCHELMLQPDNVKRFIIGRQFFTVLTNFLLAQILTFANWENQGINPVIFFIVIKSGICGVFIILAFAQLLPELLAAQFPLRFMDMYYSYSVCYISLFFDALGVGHAAWAVYYVTRHTLCSSQIETDGSVHLDTKPTSLKIQSAEVIARTSSMKYNGAIDTPSSAV